MPCLVRWFSSGCCWRACWNCTIFRWLRDDGWLPCLFRWFASGCCWKVMKSCSIEAELAAAERLRDCGAALQQMQEAGSSPSSCLTVHTCPSTTHAHSSTDHSAEQRLRRIGTVVVVESKRPTMKSLTKPTKRRRSGSSSDDDEVDPEVQRQLEARLAAHCKSRTFAA